MLTISVSLISSVAPAILPPSTNILFPHLTSLDCNSEFPASSLLNKKLFLGEQQCIKFFSDLHMYNLKNITPTKINQLIQFLISKNSKSHAYSSQLYDFLNTSKCIITSIIKDHTSYWLFSGSRALFSSGSSCLLMITSGWNQKEIFISFQNKSSTMTHKKEDLCTPLCFFTSSFI